jgi:hypothetical protein
MSERLSSLEANQDLTGFQNLSGLHVDRNSMFLGMILFVVRAVL